jgi:hypothetical protein
MNKFIAVSSFLRKRLARTSFDNVEEFRQLLLLERLVLRPLRAWPAEAMFIGLGEQFPAETRILTREFEFWGRPPGIRNIAALPRFRCEPTRLLEPRQNENGSTPGGSAPHGSQPAANHRRRTSTTGTWDRRDHRRLRAAVTCNHRRGIAVQLLEVIPLKGRPVSHSLRQEPVQIIALANLSGMESSGVSSATTIDVPFKTAVSRAPCRQEILAGNDISLAPVLGPQ